MKKELNIIGLDCGNCALTLEKYLAKINGVNECSINFSTSKLYLNIDEDNSKDIMKNIMKVSKQVNPDVKITNNTDNDNNINFIDITLYIIGMIIGLIVIIVPMNKIFYYTLLIISAIILGYRTYFKAIVQLRHIRINENTLITISIIGACALGESMEGLMVIALYTLGKMLEGRAINYSRKSISALISTQPEYAVRLINGIETKISPERVNIGDILIVKAGEKVPLDGVIISGSASVDKKHLTGESIPQELKKGDLVESGSIVLNSMLEIEVNCLYKDSTVAKILNLITSAQNKKSKTESFISKFSSCYTIGVVLASICVWGLTWAILGDISVAIYRGLIFLVVSCPCAFAISVPLSYFSGIGRCSKSGILIKGSNYLDTCSAIDMVFFDKTGTLTTGNFEVTSIEILKKVKKETLLDLVVCAESNSLHPIAKAICDYHKTYKKISIQNYKEISGKGVEFEYRKNKYFVGRGKNVLGCTQVEVRENGKPIALICLQDKIKDNAKQTIEKLHENGIKTVMLSGDNNSVTKKVGNTLGIDSVFGELLPADKFKILQDTQNKGKKVVFVGDGINDAPALTVSDVGISMGLIGSDATIESSDVVIADDNLEKIPKLISIAKYTKKIVYENIIFAGVAKLSFLVLGALGITGMLLAVFADVGVTLIAILNSLRILKCKK